MDNQTPDPVGIVGLGIMGGAMAQALRSAGHAVCGYDLQPQAQERLAACGGTPLQDATQVAEAAQLLIFSLSTTAAMLESARRVAAATRREGRPCAVVETSTLPLDDKHEAARILAQAGVAVLDCPISGTGVMRLRMPFMKVLAGVAPADTGR